MDIIWCTGTSIPNRGRSFGPPNLRVYLGIPCRKGGIDPNFSTALKTLRYFAKNTRDLWSSEKLRVKSSGPNLYEGQPFLLLVDTLSNWIAGRKRPGFVRLPQDSGVLAERAGVTRLAGRRS